MISTKVVGWWRSQVLFGVGEMVLSNKALVDDEATSEPRVEQ